VTKVSDKRGPSHGKRNVVLKVRDFGPIAGGEVDLRPLTVFAGPSNTGKSWLAILIYVMGKHVSSFPFSLFDVIIKSDMESGEVARRFPADIHRWQHDIDKRGELKFTRQEIDTLRNAFQGLSPSLESELQRCYGIGEIAKFIRHGCENNVEIFSAHIAEITHRLSISGQPKEISLKVDMPDELTLPIDSKNRGYLNFLHEFGKSSRKRDRAYDPFWSSRIIGEVLQRIDLGKNFGRVYYMPADRGGVMHAHAVVVGALIRNASRAGLHHEQSLPVLSGILSDFLDGLLKIAQPRQRRGAVGRRRNLDRKLEDSILRGTVQAERFETGYPRFIYRPEGWDRSLPMMSVSSMVSELSPVVLYLRHYVTPGDTLILEEPEAHLHPAMQRRFTAEIVSWVKAGVRVILTTHSEWVLEELSTIVARGEGGNDVDAKRSEHALTANEVGVWLFDFVDRKKQGKGSKIEEVPWDPDEGGYEAGFYDVATEGHNEWAEARRHSPGGSASE